MTNLYVTPDEVLDYLMIPRESRDGIDTAWLFDLIKMKMDYVDRLTNTTWNGRIKQTKERHDLNYYKGSIILGPGIPILLGRAPVRRIVKIEVFAGTGYDEINIFDNGRARGEYWVDRQSGILYLQKFLIRWGGGEVRVIYTYGRKDLDPRVKELTLLHVVRELLINEAFWFAIPEANNSVSLDVEDRLKYIQDRIWQLEQQLTSARIPVNTEYDVEVEDEMGDLSFEPAWEGD